MTGLSVVRVRCANTQPDLFTGKPCAWTGYRKGRVYQTPTGSEFRAKPTHERCPRCGSKVKEVPV